MSKANLFLLLPETELTTNWSNSNESIQSEKEFHKFIKNKVDEINSIEIENFDGFYDHSNLKNFFEHFDILEEYYPKVKRQLLNKLKEWEDWRPSAQQNPGISYNLFGQNINDHTLPEIAQRKINEPKNHFALLNNGGLNIQTAQISINIANENIEIDNLKNKEDLKNWFEINRIPPRRFHIIPKHGENGRGNRRGASPLMCSEQEAQLLLNASIGETAGKLFNFDKKQDMFIVFWNENEPENLYHGYHLPKDSSEIPNNIKKMLSL